MSRPRKFKSVEEMETAIQLYFEDADSREVPYTVEGLAVALDLSRQGLLNYTERDEFVDTIQKAKNKVLQHLQEYAIKGKYNSAMTIFNLKNNYGFVDKHEVAQETKTSGTLSIEIVEDVKDNK